MRDSAFQSDPERRFAALEEFRERARDRGEIPDELEERIAGRIEEVFGSREMMVRFRSSSNVEDALEFNGAGLYESTSVCVLDSFDNGGDGPSACDPEQPRERKIKRALRKVWTSLWTFRAFEERSWYQIPQDDVGMGILVTRAFLDEAANGVAFTGNPANALDRRYVVVAQLGEESVVSPEPGVIAETNVLEIEAGGVSHITASWSRDTGLRQS